MLDLMQPGDAGGGPWGLGGQARLDEAGGQGARTQRGHGPNFRDGRGRRKAEPAALALAPERNGRIMSPTMPDLLLKRAAASPGEVYDVICQERIVGRIMLSADAQFPWVWTLTYGYHEDRTPTHGYEPTREAAMQAFAKSWHRE